MTSLRAIVMLLACQPWLAATSAFAQVSYAPAAIDTTNFATKAEACPPASSMPPMEAVAATAGSATTCRRSDAVQPRISRSVSGVTGADGTAAITWPAMPSVPKVDVTPYVGASDTQVPACFPVTGTVTTTGATIKCYKTQSILGLGIAPYAAATAGVAFDILVLPAS